MITTKANGKPGLFYTNAMLTLVQRITHLESLEAIRQLTFNYAWSVNQGWHGYKIDAVEIREIFTTDAIYNFPQAKLFANGLTEIQEQLINETKTVKFAMHGFSNPSIEVDGNEGSGKWLFSAVSQLNEDKINLVFMSQEIQYRRILGGWRISKIDLQIGRVI